ncbi:hypothetical protein [Glycomyces sp. NPDC048151]|uniref:hypothetical protein n=1 Tax=Glycomyces sp. NPDC048151 TaxID=3364002 RepID=UPI00371CB8A7
MTDLDELRALLGAPRYTGPAFDWDAASDALGATIPADFRALLDTLGPGLIGNDTLLLAPGASHPSYDQIAMHRERRAGLDEIWEFEAEDPPEERSKPAVLDEHGVEPILWASSGLGYYLHWIAVPGQDPATWRIAVDIARGGEWEFLPGTATELLLGLLSGKTDSFYLGYLRKPEQHRFSPAH